MTETPKIKKNYKQKFREEWLDEAAFAHWLSQDENDPFKAYCNFCNRTLVPKYSDLLKHGETMMHKKAGEAAGIVMKKTPTDNEKIYDVDAADKKDGAGSGSDDEESETADSDSGESESDDSSSDDSAVVSRQRKSAANLRAQAVRTRAVVAAPVNNSNNTAGFNTQKRKLPTKTPEIDALRKKALRTTVMAEKEKQEYYKLKQEAVKLKIKKLEDDLGAAEINKETQSILKKAASFEYNRKTNGN